MRFVPRTGDLTFFIRNTSYAKDVFVYWTVDRSHQVLVNTTSPTGTMGTTQRRYRNATIHFLQVEELRGT